MKTKMLTALVASIVLAALACPVLASPIDRIVAGLPLDASSFPSTFDSTTVLSWWLSGSLIHCPTGTALTLLLSLCVCSLTREDRPGGGQGLHDVGRLDQPLLARVRLWVHQMARKALLPL